ncbi:hypothetical protein NC651_009085 [Populus alba x Populus x berolinensis]|nr:hypothetical protein NC651_009085 [Populus alba x Populus x berolinensis]
MTMLQWKISQFLHSLNMQPGFLTKGYYNLFCYISLLTRNN